MSTQCPQGHDIRTAADRDGQGYCRECRRASNRNQRIKQKAALDLCRGLAAYGIRFENAGQPVTPDEVAAQLLKVVGPTIP